MRIRKTMRMSIKLITYLCSEHNNIVIKPGEKTDDKSRKNP
jgi:hypothetical protein